MFSILNMLSTPNALDPQVQRDKAPQTDVNTVSRYDDLREQPTLLSAVESTLSSYYKDEGDDLLEKLSSKSIQIYFDDGLMGIPDTGVYDENENIIILSSLPDDILDISKNLYSLLKQV